VEGHGTVKAFGFRHNGSLVPEGVGRVGPGSPQGLETGDAHRDDKGGNRGNHKRPYAGLDLKCIEVIDDGPGMDQDEMQDIFVPFYTTKQEGSGIGLSLCRQVMQLHQGSISVESEKDQQTRFTLTFTK